MRVLITGAEGMLAQDLAPVFSPKNDVLALDHSACDITERSSVDRVFAESRPELVINCAAYSDVDGCERDPERAFAVNARGPGNLAEAAAACGARLFHISTDYVFDGGKRKPYEEEDALNPISVYGQSKVDGEKRVLELKNERAKCLVIRTSWLFGLHRTNFVQKTIEAAEARPEMNVVSDQVSCLTWTRHLAEKIGELAATDAQGILHIAGSGPCTRLEIASRILKQLGRSAVIRSVRWEDLHLPARRPAYSAMRSRRLPELGLQPLPDWRVALDEYMRLRQAKIEGASASR